MSFLSNYQKHLCFRIESPNRSTLNVARRLISLAETALDNGHLATIVTSTVPDNAFTTARSKGAEVLRVALDEIGGLEDFRKTIVPLVQGNVGLDCVVVDTAYFGPKFQSALAGADQHVIAFDDGRANGGHRADTIINSSVTANAVLVYNKIHADTDVLLGPRFTPLPTELLGRYRKKNRIVNNPPEILVVCSSTDSRALALAADVLPNLNVRGYRVTFTAEGGETLSEGWQATLRSACENARFVTAAEARHIFPTADVAIYLGAMVDYEVLYLRVPVIAVPATEKQFDLVTWLSAFESCVTPGRIADVSAKKIAEGVQKLKKDSSTYAALMEKMMDLVDAYGARRVLMEMLGESLWIRPAEPDDASLLLAWADDPDAHTLNTELTRVPWKSQVQRFSSSFDDPSCDVYMIFDRDDNPIGQVNIQREITAKRARFNVQISRQSKSRGLDSEAIMAALLTQLKRHPEDAVWCKAPPDDLDAIRAYVDAGFTPAGRESGDEGERVILEYRPGKTVDKATLEREVPAVDR